MKLVTGLRPAERRASVRVAGEKVTGPIEDRRHGLPEPDAAALAHHHGQRPAAAWRWSSRTSDTSAASAPRYRAAARMQLLEDGGAGRTSRGSYPWQLSGGMQQRANALPRADPRARASLMLDEPFGALDAFTREELWGVTAGAVAGRSASPAMLVTHDLREAVYLADTVYVMSRAARPHHRHPRRAHRTSPSAAHGL